MNITLNGMPMADPKRLFGKPQHVKKMATPQFSSHHTIAGADEAPVPSAKPVKTGRAAALLKTVLATVLGAGVGGTAYQGYVNQQAIERNENHLAQATQRLDANSQQLAELEANHKLMMGQVSALDGRTSQISGLNRGQLESMARQLTDLSRRADQLAARPSLLSLVDVVEKVTPSTLQVKGSQGLGSGVLIEDNQGRRFILTNSHVTEENGINKNTERDQVYHITLYSGGDAKKTMEFDASPVILANGERAASSSEVHDLALLAIPPNVKLPDYVKPVQMRDLRETIRAGEVVVAVGSPLGLKDTVTSGIISHNNRDFSLEPHNRFFQTDAAINPGNSGGGLFDLQGRLIGINTLGYRGANNLAGSIRIDVIKHVLNSWGVSVGTPAELKAVPFQVQPNPRRQADPLGVNPFKHNNTQTSANEQKPPETKPPADAQKPSENKDNKK